MWHTEPAIKTECLTAFYNVYLTDGAIIDVPKPLPAAQMANNLVKLCMRCEPNEFASLEQIICELFGNTTSSKDLIKIDTDIQLIQSLWGIVQNQLQSRKSNQAAISGVSQESAVRCLGVSEMSSALMVISMLSKFSATMFTSKKVRMIAQTVLSASMTQDVIDILSLRSASLCLQTIAQNTRKQLVKSPTALPRKAVSSKKKSVTVDSDDERAEEDPNEIRAALLSATPGIRDVILGAFCGDCEIMTRFE